MNRAFDPVLVEVLKHELAAIGEEIAMVIGKTGRSPLVRNGDFATALADGEGRILGPGYAAPVLLSVFNDALESVVARYGDELEPGDVVIHNDPYAGFGHMPDVLVVVPAFHLDRRVGFTLAYSHHTDIGGRFPGGMSATPESSYEEGVRLPMLRIERGGRRNDDVLDLIVANVREPEAWVGDLEAKVAGCRRGASQLVEVVEKYGLATYESTCEHLLDAAHRAARNAVRSIPAGSHRREMQFEYDDGSGVVGYPLVMTLEADGEHLTADFTGSAAQAAHAINSPWSMARSFVFAALRTLTSEDVFVNSGFMKAATVLATKGSIVRPAFPGGVGGRSAISSALYELVSRTFGDALPERAPVFGEVSDIFHYSWRDEQGIDRGFVDVFFGGWGGRPRKDGIDGVAPVFFGSFGTSSAEVIEREHPVVVDGFGLVADSGGPGRHRGSLSVYRQLRFMHQGRLMVRSSRLHQPSTGIAGGGPGALSETALIRGESWQNLPQQTDLLLQVAPGDAVRHAVAGSGGYGGPLMRDPALVLEDVLDGKVSLGAARDQYGVVIDPSTMTVDPSATARRRAAARERG